MPTTGSNYSRDFIKPKELIQTTETPVEGGEDGKVSHFKLIFLEESLPDLVLRL